jgi:ankyrin repeat protein
MKKVILLLLIFSGNIFCNDLTATAHQKKIMQQKQQEVKNDQDEIEEKQALIEEKISKISQITDHKSTLSSYQTIVNWLVATLAIAGFGAGAYKLLEQWKKHHPDPKARDGGSGAAGSGGGGKRYFNFPVESLRPFLPGLGSIGSEQTPGVSTSAIANQEDEIYQESPEDLGLKLINFIKSDEIDKAYNLIQERYSDINVNVADDNGETALHWAVKGSNDLLEIIMSLLDRGANVNAVDNNGRTPLHAAAESRDRSSAEIVKTLLAGDAFVNAKDKQDMTPLSLAIGKREVVQIFLDIYRHYRVSVDAEDADGTILQRALDCGDMESLILLVLAGAKADRVINRPIDEPLIKAAHRLMVLGLNITLISNVFPGLLEAALPNLMARAVILNYQQQFESTLNAIPANVKNDLKKIRAVKVKQSRSFLTRASDCILEEAFQSVSRYLGTDVVDINARDKYGWTALHWVMAKHYIFAMHALLEAGADVTLRTENLPENDPYQNMTPLDIARYNVKHAQNVNCANWWKEMIVGYWNYFDSVRAQFSFSKSSRSTKSEKLEAGDLPINEEANKLGLLLIKAIKDNNIEEAEDFIYQGASINVVDSDGKTALHWAAHKKFPGIIKMLLDTFSDIDEDQQAYINVADRLGITALHLAVQERPRGVLDRNGILISSARIILPSTNKERSKEEFQKDFLDTVHLLLSNYASVDIVDDCKRTPLHHAVYFAVDYPHVGHRQPAGSEALTNVVRLLLEEGAQVNAPDKNGNQPLFGAIDGSPEIVKVLLKFGANTNAIVNREGDTLLSLAVKLQMMELALLLILYGANVDQIANDPFMSPTTPVNEALKRAARRLLISGEQLGSINQERFPRIIPIIEAVVSGSMARQVILGDERSFEAQLKAIPENEREATLNEQDEYGWTALHWANAQHDTPRMLALLKAGANNNLCTFAAKQNRPHQEPYQNMRPSDIAAYNMLHAVVYYNNYMSLMNSYMKFKDG